ncbi:MAG TPA: Calx-beta domain-containing protein [Thermoanaerobaculia bacterium]|jgi:hypothetical protein|nr:Calx-beta domain-containing protein [Thermoanaerobaculia bacterium]
MRCAHVTARVFVFLLLALAGSAFAAPPPFTISFTQTQFSGVENEHPSVALTHAGAVPSNTIIQLRAVESPGGGTSWITFSWGTSDTQVVSVVQDDPYYNPGRSFAVTIWSVGNGGVSAEPITATLTVIDNELPPKASINDVTVVEGTSPGPTSYAVFTISLSSPLTEFTDVGLIVHDQSAKNGLDHRWSGQGGVYFYAGQQNATISIPIIGDDIPEGTEYFTVELVPQSPVQPGKTIGICTIIDDDDAISPPY